MPSNSKKSAVVETTLAHSKTDENNLTTHLRAIERCGETAKKSLFEICVRLNAINTEKLYEIGGYKNTAEWAARELLWWLENNAFSDDLKNRCHAAAALQGGMMV